MHAGLHLGALLGLLMTPPLLALGGWRLPFWVLGAAGLAWVTLWLPATSTTATSSAASRPKVRLEQQARVRDVSTVEAPHCSHPFVPHPQHVAAGEGEGRERC